MKQTDLKVNGRDFSFLVEEGETLAEVIRNRIHLTGTKIGCEQGSCGACTVVVNGKPVVSCITPALRCHNAAVTTIEGLAVNGRLHPLQEKFIEHGALQCGFCTPGMIMASYAFLNDNPSPSTDEIREALSGNLCRCTGYKKIIEAVDAAAKSMRSVEDSFPGNGRPQKKNHTIIGRPQPLVDSRDKVTGRAEYADDIFVKDALHCRFLRSPVPHAVIESIDASEALRSGGVRAVVTGEDLPEKFGVLPISQDQTALAVGKVRYAGEIVAAVAADTPAIAEAAVKRIKVKYRRLRAFFTSDEALQPAADDELIHPHSEKYGCNIHKKVEMRFGNQEMDFQASGHVGEMSFEFAGLNHAFTEPHACVAWWEKDGKLTLITATQVPHYVHRALGKVLGTPLDKIRVIKPVVGGGFGGKSDPFAHEIITAYLAKKTGKPVRTRLSREEVFLTNHGRHPTRMKVRMGMDSSGKFKSVDADIVIDGGAAGSFGVVTTYYNGVLLQAPYELGSFGFQTIRTYTNKPPCGAMRGHGGVNPRFAMEVLIDEMAARAGMDPCELRLRNFLPANTLTLGQLRITSNGMKESLMKVMEKSGWKEKYGKLPFGRGIGVACGFFISGSALPIIWNEYPQSVVHLKLDFDGRVVIYSGASDIGQGSDTLLAMIVAEALGISLDMTYVHTADTLFTPVDLGSYSSRVTFMAGNAAKIAAEKLRGEILRSVAVKTNRNKDDLNIADGRVTGAGNAINLTWKEAVDMATAGRGALSTSGWYESPKLGGDFKGAGAGLSPSYSFGALAAEVKVDPRTGSVKVMNFWGAHDVGKAINPLAVEGQLEGSWHMGMGQAMSEEMQFHEGLLLNNNFLDYRIPTSMDIPLMDTNIIETDDPEGPFGAKECGEGALSPAAPAIANAIYDAVGVRVTRLPVSPAAILGGIKQNQVLKKEQG